MASNVYVARVQVSNNPNSTINVTQVDTAANVSDENKADFAATKSKIQADSLTSMHSQSISQQHDVSVDFQDSLDEDDDDAASDISGSSTSTDSLIERSRKYLTDEAGIIILKARKYPKQKKNFDLILNFDVDGSIKKKSQLQIEDLHKNALESNKEDINRYLASSSQKLPIQQSSSTSGIVSNAISNAIAGNFNSGSVSSNNTSNDSRNSGSTGGFNLNATNIQSTITPATGDVRNSNSSAPYAGVPTSAGSTASFGSNNNGTQQAQYSSINAVNPTYGYTSNNVSNTSFAQQPSGGSFNVNNGSPSQNPASLSSQQQRMDNLARIVSDSLQQSTINDKENVYRNNLPSSSNSQSGAAPGASAASLPRLAPTSQPAVGEEEFGEENLDEGKLVLYITEKQVLQLLKQRAVIVPRSKKLLFDDKSEPKTVYLLDKAPDGEVIKTKVWQDPSRPPSSQSAQQPSEYGRTSPYKQVDVLVKTPDATVPLPNILSREYVRDLPKVGRDVYFYDKPEGEKPCSIGEGQSDQLKPQSTSSYVKEFFHTTHPQTEPTSPTSKISDKPDKSNHSSTSDQSSSSSSSTQQKTSSLPPIYPTKRDSTSSTRKESTTSTPEDKSADLSSSKRPSVSSNEPKQQLDTAASKSGPSPKRPSISSTTTSPTAKSDKPFSLTFNEVSVFHQPPKQVSKQSIRGPSTSSEPKDFKPSTSTQLIKPRDERLASTSPPSTPTIPTTPSGKPSTTDDKLPSTSDDKRSSVSSTPKGNIQSPSVVTPSTSRKPSTTEDKLPSISDDKRSSVSSIPKGKIQSPSVVTPSTSRKPSTTEAKLPSIIDKSSSISSLSKEKKESPTDIVPSPSRKPSTTATDVKLPSITDDKQFSSSKRSSISSFVTKIEKFERLSSITPSTSRKPSVSSTKEPLKHEDDKIISSSSTTLPKPLKEQTNSKQESRKASVTSIRSEHFTPTQQQQQPLSSLEKISSSSKIDPSKSSSKRPSISKDTSDSKRAQESSSNTTDSSQVSYSPTTQSAAPYTTITTTTTATTNKSTINSTCTDYSLISCSESSADKVLKAFESASAVTSFSLSSSQKDLTASLSAAKVATAMLEDKYSFNYNRSITTANEYVDEASSISNTESFKTPKLSQISARLPAYTAAVTGSTSSESCETSTSSNTEPHIKTVIQRTPLVSSTSSKKDYQTAKEFTSVTSAFSSSQCTSTSKSASSRKDSVSSSLKDEINLFKKQEEKEEASQVSIEKDQPPTTANELSTTSSYIKHPSDQALEEKARQASSPSSSPFKSTISYSPSLSYTTAHQRENITANGSRKASITTLLENNKIKQATSSSTFDLNNFSISKQQQATSSTTYTNVTPLFPTNQQATVVTADTRYNTDTSTSSSSSTQPREIWSSSTYDFGTSSSSGTIDPGQASQVYYKPGTPSRNNYGLTSQTPDHTTNNISADNLATYTTTVTQQTLPIAISAQDKQAINVIDKLVKTIKDNTNETAIDWTSVAKNLDGQALPLIDTFVDHLVEDASKYQKYQEVDRHEIRNNNLNILDDIIFRLRTSDSNLDKVKVEAVVNPDQTSRLSLRNISGSLNDFENVINKLKSPQAKWSEVGFETVYKQDQGRRSPSVTRIRRKSLDTLQKLDNILAQHKQIADKVDQVNIEITNRATDNKLHYEIKHDTNGLQKLDSLLGSFKTNSDRLSQVNIQTIYPRSDTSVNRDEYAIRNNGGEALKVLDDLLQRFTETGDKVDQINIETVYKPGTNEQPRTKYHISTDSAQAVASIKDIVNKLQNDIDKWSQVNVEAIHKPKDTVNVQRTLIKGNESGSLLRLDDLLKRYTSSNDISTDALIETDFKPDASQHERLIQYISRDPKKAESSLVNVVNKLKADSDKWSQLSVQAIYDGDNDSYKLLDNLVQRFVASPRSSIAPTSPKQLQHGETHQIINTGPESIQLLDDIIQKYTSPVDRVSQISIDAYYKPGTNEQQRVRYEIGKDSSKTDASIISIVDRLKTESDKWTQVYAETTGRKIQSPKRDEYKIENTGLGSITKLNEVLKQYTPFSEKVVKLNIETNYEPGKKFPERQIQVLRRDSPDFVASLRSTVENLKAESDKWTQVNIQAVIEAPVIRHEEQRVVNIGPESTREIQGALDRFRASDKAIQAIVETIHKSDSSNSATVRHEVIVETKQPEASFETIISRLKNDSDNWTQVNINTYYRADSLTQPRVDNYEFKTDDQQALRQLDTLVHKLINTDQDWVQVNIDAISRPKSPEVIRFEATRNDAASIQALDNLLQDIKTHPEKFVNVNVQTYVTQPSITPASSYQSIYYPIGPIVPFSTDNKWTQVGTLENLKYESKQEIYTPQPSIQHVYVQPPAKSTGEKWTQVGAIIPQIKSDKDALTVIDNFVTKLKVSSDTSTQANVTQAPIIQRYTTEDKAAINLLDNFIEKLKKILDEWNVIQQKKQETIIKKEIQYVPIVEKSPSKVIVKTAQPKPQDVKTNTRVKKITTYTYLDDYKPITRIYTLDDPRQLVRDNEVPQYLKNPPKDDISSIYAQFTKPFVQHYGDHTTFINTGLKNTDYVQLHPLLTDKTTINKTKEIKNDYATLPSVNEPVIIDYEDYDKYAETISKHFGGLKVVDFPLYVQGLDIRPVNPESGNNSFINKSGSTTKQFAEDKDNVHFIRVNGVPSEVSAH